MNFQSEFTVFLPSNVQNPTRKNTVANFWTPLSRPLELGRTWKVAISEIIVPGIQLDKLPQSDSSNFGNTVYASILTNIVEPSIVGESELPLLRSLALPIEPSGTGFATIDFKHLHYIPICQQTVREIEIKLTLQNQSVVPFEAKRSQVVLHFKRD